MAIIARPLIEAPSGLSRIKPAVPSTAGYIRDCEYSGMALMVLGL